MKRSLLVALFFVFPVVLLADPASRYIVVTQHPYATAVRSLPREDFDPDARVEMRVRHFAVIDGFAADLTAEQVRRLNASTEVRWIEPVIERHALDDTIVAGQQTTPYGVTMVHAPDVWPVTRGLALNGSGPIHVAVIDTGIDYNSPELRAIYKGGFNFITGTNNPLDDNIDGHGSHVSGIIAAADDGEGVVGVAPAIDLYALKVLDQCGSGSSENVIGAVDWIIQKKAAIGGNWVANLSLGSDQPSSSEQAAFQRGSDAGILFFAASGNGYDTNPVDGLAFPAGYPMVESVGAIDSTQKIATFSQRGPGLKVVAPGVNVLSTVVAAEVSANDGRQFAGALPVIVKDDALDPLDGFCLPVPQISGPFVDCKIGNPADFPSSVSGKIALIQRGTLKFVDKLTNAMNAGAIGVVLYNNVTTPTLIVSPALGNFTTPSAVPAFPPMISISKADGEALQATPNATVSLSFGFETWALLNGTSMSSPHAAAVAALVWAAAPAASASDVASAIENTATDLGDAGVDNVYGHGLVNALAAAELLNRRAFAPSGRTPGRRGH